MWLLSTPVGGRVGCEQCYRQRWVWSASAKSGSNQRRRNKQPTGVVSTFYYVGTDAEIHQFTNLGQEWFQNDLTTASKSLGTLGCLAAMTSLTPSWTNAPTEADIFYVGSGGQLHRLYGWGYGQGSVWTDQAMGAYQGENLTPVYPVNVCYSFQ
jgi:hypothetical protein